MFSGVSAASWQTLRPIAIVPPGRLCQQFVLCRLCCFRGACRVDATSASRPRAAFRMSYTKQQTGPGYIAPVLLATALAVCGLHSSAVADERPQFLATAPQSDYLAADNPWIEPTLPPPPSAT